MLLFKRDLEENSEGGEELETSKQKVESEINAIDHVPGGTLNTGGRAGRALLKKH